MMKSNGGTTIVKNVLAVLVVAILAIGLAGCGATSSDGPATDPVVGAWKQDSLGIHISLILESDGTGNMTITNDYTPAVESHPIAWERIDSNSIKFTVVSTSGNTTGNLVFDEASGRLYDPDRTRSRLDFTKQ